MPDRISDAEHAVMEALWDESPLAAQAVAERVGPARGWTVATVKTLLGRLLAKGVIAAEEEGRRYSYRPLVTRDDYLARESLRLVDRLFGGRLTPLVAHLAERRTVTPEDLVELEALIRELKA